MSIGPFCWFTGLGEKLVRRMVADGRLRAVRIGTKKLLIDVGSYRELMARQAAEGLPEYPHTAKATEVRKAQREGAKKRPTLEELGL
jgi:hypothetical protein